MPSQPRTATLEQVGSVPAYWSGVLAMTLCVFTLIASEFLPVSLLTPIAAEFGVGEGLAGQGLTISGVFAVLTSLSIASLAGRMNRKTLMLLLTALMVVSGATVALAPTFTVYMIGRALIGVVIGGFWSLSAAVAMRLVPPHQVPRALGIFNGGNAVAMVVAPPLGAWLGEAIGWRGAFFCLVPVGLAVLLWQWRSLPSMRAEARPAAPTAVFKLLTRAPVAVGMLAVGVFFMGQFSLFTYVRPFLETVTRVEVSTLSWILMGIGAAGVFGTTLVGFVLNRHLYRTLMLIPLLMAVVAVALTLFGHRVWPVAALLGFWGLVATAAPAGWWTWIARALPDDAETGGGLMVAVIQLSIALGSSVGGVLFDTRGYQTTFLVSAALLLAAVTLAFFTRRTES